MKNKTWTKTVLIASALLLAAPTTFQAANHREAPITALDHKADITDVFAFVSYDGESQGRQRPDKVTMILCVDPLLEPANGPTLFPFDPDILYEIKIDNNHNAKEDIVFQFRFSTEFQLPGVYTAVAGIGDRGAFAPGTSDLVPGDRTTHPPPIRRNARLPGGQRPPPGRHRRGQGSTGICVTTQPGQLPELRVLSLLATSDSTRFS